MTLETRRLSSQGPSLTTIGFGTWAIGGAGWEHSWPREAENLHEIDAVLKARQPEAATP